MELIFRRDPARGIGHHPETAYKRWSVLISSGAAEKRGVPYVPLERPSRPSRLASRAVAERLLSAEAAAQMANLTSEEALDLGPPPDALTPQEQFLRMNKEDRAAAFLRESKAMASFYADHPEELLPDFLDEQEHEPNAR